MRIVVTQIEPGARSEGYWEEGKDYTEYEDEFDEESAILLLRRLRSSRGRIYLKGETCGVEFHLDPGSPISLEISSTPTPFWAISEVSESEAELVLRMAYRGEDFTDSVPGTEREWDAWGDGS